MESTNLPDSFVMISNDSEITENVHSNFNSNSMAKRNSLLLLHHGLESEMTFIKQDYPKDWHLILTPPILDTFTFIQTQIESGDESILLTIGEQIESLRTLITTNNTEYIANLEAKEIKDKEIKNDNHDDIRHQRRQEEREHALLMIREIRASEDRRLTFEEKKLMYQNNRDKRALEKFKVEDHRQNRLLEEKRIALEERRIRIEERAEERALEDRRLTFEEHKLQYEQKKAERILEELKLEESKQTRLLEERRLALEETKLSSSSSSS